jgi:hypothetical protein
MQPTTFSTRFCCFGVKFPPPAADFLNGFPRQSSPQDQLSFADKPGVCKEIHVIGVVNGSTELSSQQTARNRTIFDKRPISASIL